MRRTRDSLNNTELSRLTSATVYDASGDKIGSACQIYLDDQTGEPTFAAVNTGLFGTSESFVPLQGYTWNGDDLVVGYSKNVVKDAPRVDADGHISEAEQAELYRYYEGLGYTGGYAGGDVDRDRGVLDRDRDVDVDRDSDLTDVGRDRDLTDLDRDRDFTDVNRDRDLDTEAAVTASEERLNVDKERVETGRARLRTYTTEEEQTVTVPVTKEKVVVERTPADGRTGGTIDADDQVDEVVAREERPVVTKETVDVEEVRLGKERVTENETVTRATPTATSASQRVVTPTPSTSTISTPTRPSTAARFCPRHMPDSRHDRPTSPDAHLRHHHVSGSPGLGAVLRAPARRRADGGRAGPPRRACRGGMGSAEDGLDDPEFRVRAVLDAAGVARPARRSDRHAAPRHLGDRSPGG